MAQRRESAIPTSSERVDDWREPVVIPNRTAAEMGLSAGPGTWRDETKARIRSTIRAAPSSEAFAYHDVDLLNAIAGDAVASPDILRLSGGVQAEQGVARQVVGTVVEGFETLDVEVNTVTSS